MTLRDQSKVYDNIVKVLKRHGKNCQCNFCDVAQECFGGISNTPYDEWFETSIQETMSD